MSTPTAEQVQTLLTFLEEHRDLARGILRSVEGRVRSLQLWESICTTLNSMGGCTKTTKQWQKVWTDKKYLAKKAAAAAKRSAAATGGGPSTAPQLSQWELRVISIIEDGFGEPQTTARVPTFLEPAQNHHQDQLNPHSVPAEIETEDIPYLEEVISIEQRNLPASSGPAPGTQRAVTTPTQTANQTTRIREQRLLRRHQSAISFRENLLRLDEARVQIGREQSEHMSNIRGALAEIRDALAELCGLAREYMNQRGRN